MGNLSIGLKQIYGGIKTMFGYGAKAAKTASAKSVYHGPSIMDLAKRQPLGLPAPTAEQLAADVPKIMVPKVLGRNLDELKMSQEILADGSHVRYFRGPESNKILIKMKDNGRFHQEWIHSNKGEIYVKTTGNGDRYVVNRKGDFIQIENQSIKYKDGINQKISTNDLYYNDHNGSGIHINNSNGFNGEHSAYCDILGSIKERKFQNGQTHTRQIDYGAKAKEPYNKDSKLDFRHAPKSRLSVIDVYDQYGDRVGEKAYAEAEKLLKMGKENFISDIDEAFFTPYKS